MHTTLSPNTNCVAKLAKVTGYQPIILCNVKYNTFTKVLTNRLQSVISDLVGEHQTRGNRGRTVNTDTHVARSVPDCCSERTYRVAMLQVNISKAFDHVRHDVLFNLFRLVSVG